MVQAWPLNRSRGASSASADALLPANGRHMSLRGSRTLETIPTIRCAERPRGSVTPCRMLPGTSRSRRRGLGAGYPGRCHRRPPSVRPRQSPTQSATAAIAHDRSSANLITPLQALCLAERTALLTGCDVDFVLNITGPLDGVRWGDLIAFGASEDDDSPLQLRDDGISTYAIDWQLREIGGVVWKSALKEGSYRVLDLPPFLAELLRWVRDNRRETCNCPSSTTARPAKVLTRPRRTTYSSAPKPTTFGAPTTPTAISPRRPKASTRRAGECGARSTSSLSHGQASRSLRATRRSGPPTWPRRPGPVSPASFTRTTTATRIQRGSTPPTSPRCSRWTAAATPCPEWTPSTTTSPQPCASIFVTSSNPSGTKP